MVVVVDKVVRGITAECADSHGDVIRYILERDDVFLDNDLFAD